MDPELLAEIKQLAHKMGGKYVGSSAQQP